MVILKKLYIDVSQGSIVGPLLFNIYENELLNLNILGNMYSYSDNTVLLINMKNI